jgi:hypothetical protein
MSQEPSVASTAKLTFTQFQQNAAVEWRIVSKDFAWMNFEAKPFQLPPVDFIIRRSRILGSSQMKIQR